jgi:enamine deaminase RidA (YjgF/YER057c/UK114 family)
LRAFAAILLLPSISCGTPPAEEPSVPTDSEFLFIPSTTGLDPATGSLADDVTGQFRQAMENTSQMLASNGMDLSRVVSVNVYLSDVDHFAEMNEVYRTYFPTDPPTRATVAVDLAQPGALVQVAMVAARPGVTRQVIKPTDLKSPELPYSWGIMAGNTLFVAGATSRDPETYQPVTGDIATQTRRVWGNIGAVLSEAGLDYGDLSACTVFLDDPQEFGEMNAAYREFMTDAPPARATVRAQLVNVLFKIEIQCVAAHGVERTVTIAEGASPPSSPFSPAIKAGDRAFTAGAVGSGPGGVAIGDIDAQTRQVLSNLQATLAAAGKGFGDVSAMYVYLPQIAHAEPVGAILDEVVGNSASRTVVGAELMGPDYLVEIMMIVGG